MKPLRIAAATAALAVVAAVSLAAGPPVALKTLVLGHGPTLVFVHSLGLGKLVWMPTARKLIADHRVVLVDLPGHGDSPMPDPFSLQAVADALDGVLAKQPSDSVILVGHGLGGLVSLLEASAHPERVRGLVVIDAAARAPFDVPDQQKQQLLEAIDEHYDDFVRRLFTSLGRDSAQGVEIHAQAALVAPAVMKAYLRELVYADAEGAVRKLDVPFLFVASAKQWPLSKDWPTVSKELGFDGLPGARAKRIPDSGFLVMSDQPDSLAAALREFTAEALATPRR